MKLAVVLLLVSLVPAGLYAGENEANEISDRIQNYHMPHGIVGDMAFSSPTSTDMVRLFDGDGAIWTGHYLAAEVFRYAVTRSPVALEYAKRALNSVKALSEISGTGRLARTMFPPNSPYIDFGEKNGTWHLTNYNGQEMYYISYVTRDQYVGVFLGLALAYDLIDDPEVQNTCREIVTRLTDHLIKVGWILYDRDSARPLETFVGRFDQMLSVLQVAKHMNPQRFAGVYETKRKWWSWLVGLPVKIQANDPISGYYKFNLDYGYFFNLIRLEADDKIRAQYLKDYAPLWEVTKTHLNAHFNMIDFALRGPDGARDQVTRESLDALLVRGFRDYAVDLRGKYKACQENIACDVVPVAERPPSDFMWQRVPFHLYGGGDGSRESAGIDYILPYWMARYFGVL